MNVERNAGWMRPRFRADIAALLGIAFMVALVHLLTNGRYGFHRDELQTLSDARHLDWGFVAYPPLTPFLERIGLDLFGVSLVGLRLFAVIAQALAIVITGLMAGELGGGRLAQVAAALSVALSPLPLFEGTEFQYTSFDYLWWMLVRLLHHSPAKDREPAMVAGDWRGGWRRPDDQIHDALLRGWNSGRTFADAGAPFPCKLVALGWGWAGLADFSAQSHMASAP